jgi:hypothetical protein
MRFSGGPRLTCDATFRVIVGSFIFFSCFYTIFRNIDIYNEQFNYDKMEFVIKLSV